MACYVNEILKYQSVSKVFFGLKPALVPHERCFVVSCLRNTTMWVRKRGWVGKVEQHLRLGRGFHYLQKEESSMAEKTIMSLAPSKCPLPIAVALLSHTVSEAENWITTLKSLVNQQLFDIVAVWSMKRDVSVQLQQALCPSATVYAAVENPGQNKSTPTLNDLLNSPYALIKGIVILNDSHKATKEAFESLLYQKKLTKHIFYCSLSFPSLTLGKTQLSVYFGKILEKASSSNWVVAQTLKWEPAVKALSCCLPDLGMLLGGELRGSCGSFSNQSTSMDRLLQGIMELCSLLYYLFDDISSASGVSSQASDADVAELGTPCLDAKIVETGAFMDKMATENKNDSHLTYSGWIRLKNGLLFSLLAYSTKEFSLNLTVWGSRGSVSLNWNVSKQCFEVQRCLNHFEYPSLFGSSTQGYSLFEWGKSCLNSTPLQHDKSPQEETLCSVRNVNLAHTFLLWPGVVVGVIPVSTQRFQSLCAKKDGLLKTSSLDVEEQSHGQPNYVMTMASSA